MPWILETNSSFGNCQYCAMTIHDNFGGLYRVENTWVEVQKQTFTNWLNFTLGKSPELVRNIYSDLNDGIVLIKLFKALSNRSIERYNSIPDVNTKKLENLSIALKAFSRDGVPLINIGPADVFYGNEKLILGLLWHIILHYHVGTSLPLRSKRATSRTSSVSSLSADETSQKEPREKNSDSCKKSYTKELLLQWIQNVIPHLHVTNLTTHWHDGNVLCHLLNTLVPRSIPANILSSKNAEIKLDFALKLARDSLNIPILVSPVDIASGRVDEFSILTYLCFFTKSGGIAEKWSLEQLKMMHPNVANLVQNMTTSWIDGVALSVLLDECIYLQFPDVPRSDTRRIRTLKDTFLKASELFGFKVAMDVGDFENSSIAPICFISYVSNFIQLSRRLLSGRDSSEKDLIVQVNSVLSDFKTCRFSIIKSSRSSRFIPNEVDVKVSQTLDESISFSKIIQDVPVHMVGSTEYSLEFEFNCIENHTYEIKAYYFGNPVSESPTIYPSSRPLPLSEVIKEQINLTEPQNVPSVVNSEIEFQIDIPDGHILMDAHYVCSTSSPSSKKFPCNVIKRSQGKYIISTSIPSVGTYYLVLKIDNQMISIPERTIKVSDPAKVQVPHSLGSTIQCGENYTIEVDVENAGEGTLACDVQLLQEHCGKPRFGQRTVTYLIRDSDRGLKYKEIVIQTPSGIVGEYAASIFWNGVLSSTVNFFSYDPNKLIFSGIRQSQPVLAMQPLKLNIITAGVGKIEKLEALFEYNDDPSIQSMIELELASLDFYQGSYILRHAGSYTVKAYVNSSLVVLAFSVLCVDLSKISVEHFQSTLRVSEEFKIQVFVPLTAGKGDISSLLIGPQGPLKMTIDDVTHTDEGKIYTLLFVPNSCGSHMICITYAGFDLPNFPQRIHVEDICVCDDRDIIIDLKSVTPTVYKSTSCFKIFVPNTKKKQVNGIITGWVESYNEHFLIDSQPVDFQLKECEDEEYCIDRNYLCFVGQYEVKSKYPKKLHVYHGSKPIPQSPFTVMVIEINNIKTRPILQKSERFFVNHIHCFEIYGEEIIIDGPISCTIEGPDGPLEISLQNPNEISLVNGKNSSSICDNSQTLNSRKLDQNSSCSVISFTPKTCGMHILTVAYCGMYLNGFPFTFNVEKLTPEIASTLVRVNMEELDNVIPPTDVCFKVDVKRSTLMAEITGSLHSKSSKISTKSEMIKFVKNDSEVSLDWIQHQATVCLPDQSYDKVRLLINSIELLNSPYTINYCNLVKMIKIEHPGSGLCFAPYHISLFLPKLFPIEKFHISLQHLTQKGYKISQETIQEVTQIDDYDLNLINPPKLKKHQYRLYHVVFLPTKVGIYDLFAIYGGVSISNFSQKVEIRCNEFCDSSKVYVNATGFNFLLCDIPHTVKIDTEDAGTGVLAVQLQNMNREYIPTKIDHNSSEPETFYVSFTLPFCGDYNLDVYWSETHVPGSPFSIVAVRPYDNLHLRNQKIPDGYVNETTRVYLDCKNGERIDELCCRCINPKTKEIVKTTIEHIKTDDFDSFQFELFPHIPGEFLFEVQANCQPIHGSPYPYHVSVRPLLKEDKVSVYGPGLSPGYSGRHDGFFWVRIGEGTGSGNLRVSVTGFQNSFDLFPHFEPNGENGVRGELYREIMFVFDPTEAGEYLICVYWNDKHVGNSPYQVKISDPQPYTVSSNSNHTDRS